MQLVFQCPRCLRTGLVEISSGSPVECPACHWQRAIPPEHLVDDKPQCCLACGNTDLWRQKDFPQALGLLLVVIGGTLSTIAYAYMRPILAIGILMGFAAIDLFLFVAMKDVLVCYRCHARHRRFEMDDDHPRFNLELNERYRQESIRLSAAEKQQQS